MGNVFQIDRTYGHIDLSTGGEAPLRARTYTLFTNFPDHGRQEWKFVALIPYGVDLYLTASDWEIVLRKLDTRPDADTLSAIESIILSARLNGKTIQQVQVAVSAAVEKTLARVHAQKRVTNGDKAWLEPSTMVRKEGASNGN